jgi:U3 small nucleolar RNA-associated protein 5
MTSTNVTNRKSKRDDPKRSSAPTIVVPASEQQVTKTKNAIKSNEAVVLTQTSNTINNKKRRATEIIQNEVPLSERLSAFESQTSTGQLNTDQKQQSLSADSLVTLLTQGLQSSDTTLLDQVLSCRNEKIIEKTVRALSIPVLLPLIDCLNKYLYQSADKGLIASKWLRAVLSTHTSYLMTCPDITERLGPMYELIEARTRLYPKLARLHGKLSLIASQINSRNNELSNSDATISTKPSFIFEDVSDEDIDGDQTQDELVPSPSEYDEYSGLSDDLDLGIQDNDDEEAEEEDEMKDSDDDLNFEENGHLNGDDNESDDNDSS